MGNSLQIHIIGDSVSGLAEIMCGYLEYYGDSKITVSVAGIKSAMHPLAQQVLREDGIDFISSDRENTGKIPDLTIYINTEMNMVKKDNQFTRTFNFTNPLSVTDYEIILSTYRQVREEIKKECIELVGNLQLA